MHLPEYRNSICGLPSRLNGCIPSCECASKRDETEVTGSTVGLVSTNALVSGGGSLFTDWPETGFAEIRIALPPSRLVDRAIPGLLGIHFSMSVIADFDTYHSPPSA